MIDPHDSNSLLSRLPRIRRARGYRLYAETGERILDLWQNGGSAILGHTPPRVLAAFKDAAARGLFCPFPSPHNHRFIKALESLVPGRSVRWYSNPATADRALSSAGFGPLALFGDPAVEELPPDCRTSFWRPWLPLFSSDRLPPVLSPVLPIPHPGVPVAFLIEEKYEKTFPPSDTISPVLLVAAARALADLIAALAEPLPRPSLRLAADLARLPGRTLRGTYLSFAETSDANAYSMLFDSFLKKGFLLPPDPRLPAILPAGLAPGEEKALVAAIAGL